MKISIHSMVEENTVITVMATIRFPESPHVGFTKHDTDEEKKEKKQQLDVLLGIYNDEHKQIRGLHLGKALLIQTE